MIEATVTGNVGKAPELKTTSTGKSMCRFSVASSSKNGDSRNTTWVDVVCFDEMADVVSQAIKKGERVVVTGRMEVRQYEKKDGTAGSSLSMTASEVGRSLRFIPKEETEEAVMF